MAARPINSKCPFLFYLISEQVGAIDTARADKLMPEIAADLALPANAGWKVKSIDWRPHFDHQNTHTFFLPTIVTFERGVTPVVKLASKKAPKKAGKKNR
jgi:hypothetical protein